MPITCAVSPRAISQDEFAKMDYEVMRRVFESQNELGRLCDEAIYRNDVASRLEAAGLHPVVKEAPVTVQHGDFKKVFRMDLVVGDVAVYEFKTERCLALDHEAQLLNYLLLCGGQHGKLVNFRPPQVESRFVNGRLAPQARRQFEVDTGRWHELDDGSRKLRAVILGLLQDWGNFLELSLYTEALIHFFGGEQSVAQRIEMRREGRALGNQRFLMASQDIAWRLTALSGDIEGYAPQLQTLLRHSSLRAIQWINLGRCRIDFITILR